MKKRYSFIFIIVLCLSLVNIDTTYAASGKIMYATSSTTLKETANSKAKTLKNISKGSSVTVYTGTKKGSYYKAKYSNKTGWILKSKVSDTKKLKTTKSQTLKYKTVEQKDNSLAKGKTKVAQNGKNGTQVVTYEKTYKKALFVRIVAFNKDKDKIYFLWYYCYKRYPDFYPSK